jgi:hypothetical protein
MRTTISLDDQLLKRAKKAAAERGVSFAQLVEEAVREALAKKPVPAKEWKLPPATGRDGLAPGVDLASNESIWGALERDDIEALQRINPGSISRRRDGKP